MSITASAGFVASGVTAGLKASGRSDIALVVNEGPLHVAAAVFTTNRVFAAPVAWSLMDVSTLVIVADIRPWAKRDICNANLIK